MDWTEGMQNAIKYIEAHLTENMQYAEIAKQGFSSVFHFQRVFGILCGCTLGEYIRYRRLSLAGQELAEGKERVLDVALRYGYESPDSFGRAFVKFHGITPSEASGQKEKLRFFHPLKIKVLLEGGEEMHCKVVQKEAKTLVGFKQRFYGVPFGALRAEQEEKMFVSTRAKQWLLRGAASDYYTDYCVIQNADDTGYDFYIANELNAWTRENLYNRSVTGVDFMEDLGLEEIHIPKQTYVVLETPRSAAPMEAYMQMRKNLVTEWLPASGYQFADGPELALLHWRTQTDKESRFVEIRIPVEPVN